MATVGRLEALAGAGVGEERMQAARAVVAGLAGASAMSVAAAAGQALGVDLHLELMLGAALGLQAPWMQVWLAGLLVHLIVGGWLAVVYAVGFEAAGVGRLWPLGAVFGLVHAMGAGIWVAILGRLAPGIGRVMAVPDICMGHLGSPGVAAFIIVHLVYGAVVGAVYGRTRPPTSESAGLVE